METKKFTGEFWSNEDSEYRYIPIHEEMNNWKVEESNQDLVSDCLFWLSSNDDTEVLYDESTDMSWKQSDIFERMRLSAQFGITKEFINSKGDKFRMNVSKTKSGKYTWELVLFDAPIHTEFETNECDTEIEAMITVLSVLDQEYESV